MNDLAFVILGLIGVSSYLLINFWFNRINSNIASYQALIMNRIGDWGLIIFIISIYLLNSNLDYDILLSLAYSDTNYYTNDTSEISEVYLTIVSLFVIISAMGKSAQIGLHNWLPMSMEGPTPVSALLHAATLVTAGIYIIIMTTDYLTSTSLIIICIISSVTALFAALNGIYSYDVKKIIAYSTCSQLGYMLLAIGLNQYSIGLFHLLNHAYFKALLFLSAGSIIHSLNDEQDIRRMGGLIAYLPFTYTMVLIGTLSLIAFPFLTGYYSKDVILEIAGFPTPFENNAVFSHLFFESISPTLPSPDVACIAKDKIVLSSASPSHYIQDKNITNSRCSYQLIHINKNWTIWLGTFTVILTTIYSMLTILYIFYGNPSVNSIKIVNNIHEPSVYMSVPLIILSILSITSGYYLKELYTPSVEYEILVSAGSSGGLINTQSPYIKMFMPTIISIISIIVISLSYVLITLKGHSKKDSASLSSSGKNSKRNQRNLLELSRIMESTSNGLGLGLFRIIMFDQIGNVYNKITKGTLRISWDILKNIDQGVIMLIGPYGLSELIKKVSMIHSNHCEIGLIRAYIYQIIIAVIFLLIRYIAYVN